MSRALPHALVWLTAHWWEGPEPVEGDFLKTPTGRCYKIEFIRKAQEGNKYRYRLRCRVLTDNAVDFGEAGVFEWRWNPR